MAYPASFLMGMLGQLLATGIEFAALWMLFDRFGSLQGWTLGEVALFYGLAHCGFALCDFVGAGFDQAGELIRRGELDRLLLRPRSTVLQMLAFDFPLRRCGRLLQGLAVLIWAICWGGAGIEPIAWLLIPLIVCAAGMLFLGLLVLQATLSIWTVQTLELVNCTTYGGVFAAQHPFAIYGTLFRWFFTAIVPLACVLYWPVLIVLGRGDPLGAPHWIGWLTLWAGPLFFGLTLVIWSQGLRRYTSCGS
jgi:ABC-2 type transport system permease protein